MRPIGLNTCLNDRRKCGQRMRVRSPQATRFQAKRTASFGLAAPAGGATRKGRSRGCILTFIAAPFIAALCIAAPLAAEEGTFVPDKLSEEELAVPSGAEVSFQDMVWDERGFAGLTYRFRFVSPSILSRTFEEVAVDMEHLCNAYAVPRLSLVGPRARQVIISIASEASEFGVAQPDILQFFEAYRIEEDRCIWELF